VKYSSLVLTAQQIRDRLVCEVTSADTYINNAPVPGGLYDPRMGVDYAMLRDVATTTTVRPGHPDTSNSLSDVQRYLRRHGRKPLRCICINCSHSLIDDDSIIPSARPKRFNLAEKECLKVKNCPTCGAKTADKITWDKQAKMTMEWKSDVNEAVTRDVRL
jgi:DNA-directed RNA polymerase II subunit RPB1